MNTWGIFWIVMGAVLVFESFERILKSYFEYRYKCKQLKSKGEENE